MTGSTTNTQSIILDGLSTMTLGYYVMNGEATFEATNSTDISLLFSYLLPEAS